VKIIQKHLACNYDAYPISVEFLIIHYSATSLDGLLKIFFDEQAKVSAHFVISTEGEVMELVPCLDGVVHRAWHAGRSRWHDEREWAGFNDFSIGIELINLNGNIFPYTWKQTVALKELILHLQSKFPALKDPARILGHEHIAGFRGKVDPGICFDWADVFRSCYAQHPVPALEPALPPEMAAAVKEYLRNNGHMHCNDDLFWQQLNTSLEQRKMHSML
jgi:N-acetylmuramoyl-L-alanine amidase